MAKVALLNLQYFESMWNVKVVDSMCWLTLTLTLTLRVVGAGIYVGLVVRVSDS